MSNFVAWFWDDIIIFWKTSIFLFWTVKNIFLALMTRLKNFSENYANSLFQNTR